VIAGRNTGAQAPAVSAIDRAGPAPAGPAARRPAGRGSLGRALRRDLGAYAFLFPYLLAFVLFTVIPVVFGLYVSLHKWSEVNGDQGFVGLHNYTTLLSGSGYYGTEFYTSMANTLIFVVISVPFLWAIPAGLAYLVAQAPVKQLWRILFFYPAVFSASAFGTIWSYLLATNGGSVNSLFHVNIQWLTAMPDAWIAIDLATIWATMGFNFIIMYAGITQIPKATIEAAQIDGAGSWTRLRRVVLPQVRPVSVVVVVIATIASFNLFVQDLVMTNGGPGTSTDTIAMTIYQEAFNSFNAGTATAMAFLLAVVLAVIALLQYRFASRRS
jgi:multiple sugar transport system permease protein